MFDLHLYLDSIGLSRTFHINSLSDFELLARKHFKVFPYTTLGFQIKREVRLDADDLYYRLKNEGFGHAFHHNATFYLALNALGIKTSFISILVRNPNKPEETYPIHTHVALLVQWRDGNYLFDPGFDGRIQPIPLDTPPPKEASVFVVPSNVPHHSYTLAKLKNNHPVPLYDFNITPITLPELRNGYTFSESKLSYLWSTFIYVQATANGAIYSVVGQLDKPMPLTLSIYSPEGWLVQEESVKGDSFLNVLWGRYVTVKDQPFLKILGGHVVVPESVTQTIKESRFSNPAMHAAFHPNPATLSPGRNSLLHNRQPIIMQSVAGYCISHL